jgi:hypothetical protein
VDYFTKLSRRLGTLPEQNLPGERPSGMFSGFPGYNDMEMYNRMQHLRREIARRQEAQHFNKAFQLTQAQRDGVKNIDRGTNVMEEEAEEIDRLLREFERAAAQRHYR